MTPLRLPLPHVRRVRLVVVLLSLMLAGGSMTSATQDTGSTAPPPAGSDVVLEPGTQRIELAGGRWAMLYVPVSHAGRPVQRVPAVVALHGGLGSAEQFADASGLAARAEAGGFLVAFGQGGPARRFGTRDAHATWNGGACCGGSVVRGDDDVAYLDELLARLVESYAADPARLVMTGHSNGAIMTFRYVCEGRVPLAAAMPVAGSLETADPTACTPSVARFQAVHGDADVNHPLDGGYGSGVANVPFRPFADSVAAVAAGAGCDTGPSTSTSGVVIERAWDCPAGTSVRSLVLIGAEHPWPGGRAGTRLGGTPFAGWSASDEVAVLVAETVQSAHSSVSGA